LNPQASPARQLGQFTDGQAAAVAALQGTDACHADAQSVRHPVRRSTLRPALKIAQQTASPALIGFLLCHVADLRRPEDHVHSLTSQHGRSAKFL
ncbi:hypothetical protein, partial [Methylobacterium oxalidis]|uniref:hypothetical protein n=1 Tax=Methylobacterium oxalidis TaxID=944322 RepID=UPI001AEF173B